MTRTLALMALLTLIGCADDARPNESVAPDNDSGMTDAGGDLSGVTDLPDAQDSAPDLPPDLPADLPPKLLVLWPPPHARLPGGRVVLDLEVEGAEHVRWRMDDQEWRAWLPHSHATPVPPGPHLIRIEARAGLAITTRELSIEIGAHLAAGDAHSGAITDGAAHLWGQPPSAPLDALPPLVHLSGRGSGMGAIDADGDAWLWGAIPGGDASPQPIKVPGPWLHMTHSGASLWLINTSGELWVMGRNDRGQLGLGHAASVPALTRVESISDVVMSAAGTSHALILRADGLIWAVGDNADGQLGTGDVGADAQLDPVLIPTASHIVQIAAGRQHSLALRDDGAVIAWGSGTIGQLGHGTSGQLASRAQPVPVVDLPPVSAIAATNLQSYALGRDRTLWAWGQNSLGQLGTGSTTNAPRPRQLPITAPLVEVAPGLTHGVAIDADGQRWGWGVNASGQLLDDGPARSSSPLPLPASP
jgi:hypothetical protein